MKYFVGFFCFFCTLQISAQLPTITTNNSNSVTISEVAIDTKIFGNLATTEATYVFQNNSSRDLEGTLTFPLPEGVSVSGYALDIRGSMREAVPVPKERAKEVFESISRRNVDPGIIEKVEGNNFRTRVYPIPANGKRTIQITYQQELKPLDNQKQFYLSFANATQFKNFTLKVSLFENGNAPKIIENPDGSFTFNKKDNLWVAQINKTNFKPNESLLITIPDQTTSEVIIQPTTEQNYFFAANVSTSLKTLNKNKPSKVVIFWDNSLSGSKRNIEKEFSFLDTFFKEYKNIDVQLALLNVVLENGGNFNITNGNWQELRNYLVHLKYDGATDFGLLKEFSNIDEYLLFSDGMSNFGDLTILFKKPVTSITSSTTSDFNVLKQIAEQSGGRLINLNQQSVSNAFEVYQKQPIKLLLIKGLEAEDVFPKIGSSVENKVMLFGKISSNSGQIIAVFEGSNQQKEEVIININPVNSTSSFALSKIWAQQKINDLETNPSLNHNKIKEISQKYGIVSKNTSLIVLEDINDYVRYKIVPPKELLNEYNNILAQNKNLVLSQRRQLLSKAFDKSKELQTWWNMDFEKKDIKKKPALVNQSTNASNKEFTISGNGTADAVSYEEISDKDGMIDRRTQKGGKITLIDVESNEEYMAEFKNLEAADVIYQKYLQLRPKYDKYVPFYFDISKLLFKKDSKLSYKVLSTLAELDIENEELFKTICYILKQRGFYQKELWIAKKIKEWRPFDSQSHRDYAQALLDNKKNQEALDVYKSLLYQEFTNETEVRDEGIEEILIMEINNILNLDKTIDATKIDNRLKANLPVDIRVVINWNKDHTDIDLHIEDPNGEECFYSQNTTTSGGRLSNDFTDGFGPEQFLLKKATKGKYIIKTNYFGDNQLLLSGPTTIMAEVFLYYSDGRQERKIAVFQSHNAPKNDGQGKIIIGEFTF